jgi:hypothetical protein
VSHLAPPPTGSQLIDLHSGRGISSFLRWLQDLYAFINRVHLTASLNFPNTLAQTSSDLTVTIPGIAVGDFAILSLPAAPNANSSFTTWVSAEDTVTVRFNNYSAAAINPAEATFGITVIPQ